MLVSFPEPTCRPDTSWSHWATPADWDSIRTRRAAARDGWKARIAHTGYQLDYGQQSLLHRLAQAGAAGLFTST